MARLFYLRAEYGARNINTRASWGARGGGLRLYVVVVENVLRRRKLQDGYLKVAARRVKKEQRRKAAATQRGKEKRARARCGTW
jgi:hypothetical protein